VELDGSQLGHIENERVYQRAEQMMQERMVLDSTEMRPFYTTPSYRIVIIDDEKIADAFELADRIIQSSGAC
jgi:hypothetical protein